MNLSLVAAMVAVLLSWAVLVPVLCGIGIAFQRVFGLRRISTATLLISPWNGLACIILFLQLWHFLFPIQWPALALVSAVAIAGLLFSSRELAEWFRSIHIGWPVLIAIAVAAGWTSNRAIGPGDAFDSGVYHYAVIRWSHEFAIIPGLANLQPYFAFNNACHLFDAMLKVGPWERRANHLDNGLLIIVWLATVVISAARLVRGHGSRAQNLFNVVLLLPLVMLGVSKESSSPTSDLPQAALTFAAGSALFRLLARDDHDGPTERSYLTASVVFLGAAALCVKLTAASTVIPLAIVALAVYLWRTCSWRMRWKTLLWSAGLSLALGFSWMARSVVLSGFPLYPSRVLAMPVDWRVPDQLWSGVDQSLRQAGEDVRIGMLRRASTSSLFKKLPGSLMRPINSALGNPNGVRTWMLAMLLAGTMEVALPFIASMLIVLWLLIRRARGRLASARARPSEWLILVAPLIGLTVWFILSPEPRYAVSSFWMIAAALASIAMRAWRHEARIICGIVAMTFLPIVYRMMILAVNPASGTVSSALFIPAGPDHGFHPVPVQDLVVAHSRWGFVVSVPPNGGPHWDAPLPSSSTLNRSVRLRDPLDMQSGFVTDLSKSR